VAEGTKDLAPSEGLFLKWLIAGALILIPIVLLALYYRAMFSGLVNNAALDLAQVGRNLSDGRGFTTYFLRPLALTHGGNALRQPDVTHGPLYPVVLALGFGALGAKDTVAAGISGLFYVLTTPVLYWLGQRVFQRNVGLIAALVFAANPMMLEYATSGLPITFFVFLTTCLLAVMYHVATKAAQADSAVPKGPVVLIGLLTGALYLTDPVFIWFVPVVLIAVLLLNSPAHRVRVALLFGLPMAVLMLPWMVRNALLTGNPVFGLRGMEVWMNTPGFYPGMSAYRNTPSDLVPSAGLLQAVMRKVVLGSGEVVQAFPQISASWMLAFLLPSLLFRFKNPATNSLRRVMMYCFAGLLVGMLPLGIELPVFASLIPAMLVFAVAYLLHLVEQAQLPRASQFLLAALLGAALLLPVVRVITMTDKPGAIPEVMTAKALKQTIPPDQMVLSDQPWLVAWYADRPALWIPAVDSKITGIRSQFKAMHWLFLTPQVSDFSPKWKSVYAALGRWNVAYLGAQEAGKRTPDPVMITGTGDPLLEGLNGFTVVPPTPDRSPSTILAVLSSDKPSRK
jgi:4-amino-4-deoxy-L-arabinose transferase-like glycosyltransferase